jgi:REP element-mobilizing transposase RayT
MVLNDAGRMVEKWYRKTQDKFPDIVCHEMVIMPNHFHCIWENVGLDGASAVGADPRVRPVNKNVRPVDKNVNPIENNAHDFENNVHHIDNNNGHIIKNVERHYDEGAHAGAPLQLNDTVLETTNIIIVDKYNGDEGGHVGPPLQDTDLGTHTGSPLSSVVQWFKTMSTNEYIRGVKQLGWPPFDRKLWQRNYYEHIIRDDISLQTIAYYIINNPAQWRNDKFFQPTQSI